MNFAQQQSTPRYSIPDEEKERIRQMTGRSWEELTPEEQDAVFQAYEGKRSMGQDLVAQGSDMMSGAGKEVGPLNVYVNNPWESLAGGLMAGAGYGMQRKANRDEKEGRGALADLQTRRDSLDRAETDRKTAEEERKRREWLTAILGRQR